MGSEPKVTPGVRYYLIMYWDGPEGDEISAYTTDGQQALEKLGQLVKDNAYMISFHTEDHFAPINAVNLDTLPAQD